MTSSTPLTIREGHRYRRRDGGVVGPLNKKINSNDSRWTWLSDFGEAYTDQGHYWPDGRTSKYDLVQDLGPAEKHSLEDMLKVPARIEYIPASGPSLPLSAAEEAVEEAVDRAWENFKP